MRKIVKHYFIPHEGNDYKPHFFHRRTIGVISLFAAVVFTLSLGYSAILSHIDYLTAVLPSVLIDLANSDRSIYKLTPLTRNATLEVAAKEKANDMARYSYFAHSSPTGITPWYWFTKSGYRFIYAGENLAINFSDSGAVNQAWMNSPGHRSNILNINFTEIGIATAEGMYQGQPTTYVVQMFGKPIQTALPPLTPIASAKEQEAKVTLPTEPKVVPVTETYLPDRQAGTFIAVKNAEVEEPPLRQGSAGQAPLSSLQPSASSVVHSATEYATLPQKIFSSPRTMLELIYFILIAVVLSAIVLSLGIELRHHHAKHLISGVFVIILLVGLTYLYQHISGLGGVAIL